MSKRVYIQDVLVSVDALEHRLDSIMARRSVQAPERLALAEGVRELLGKARQAALGVFPKHRWASNWWRATLLEAAYQYLHAANVLIVELYDPDDVESAVPAALAKVQRQLGRDDPRRIRAEKLSALKTHPARRDTLRESLDAAYAASDAWHRRQRSFRNIIILAAVGIAVLLGLVWVLVGANPSAMPFCFDDLQPAAGAPAAAVQAVAPDATSTPVLALETTSCPTGEAPGREPGQGDIQIILLMGALGGALAAAISIRNVRGASTPYDIPVALACLKVPTGALTAVVGLIAIRGNFVPGLSALDSQEQILAYALVLGYAQQLATGFLDRRAQSLAKDLTPDPSPPAAPAPAPTPAPEPPAPSAPPASEPPAPGGAGTAAPESAAVPPGPEVVSPTARSGKSGLLRRMLRLPPGR